MLRGRESVNQDTLLCYSSNPFEPRLTLMQDADYNVIVGTALPAAAHEKVNNESETDKTVCTLLEVIGQIGIALHCVMCTYRGGILCTGSAC